jgi:glycosyltransferase involved in cell wall biosynthesis
LKLMIQIPCLDEERDLPRTLSRLPRRVDGFDRVEWLVVDDGSTDRTLAVAREGGVDHLVSLTNNKGLAAAFQAGLDASLKLGADVIVNTDADGQYDPADIPRLVAPILDGYADMVVGDRQVEDLEHFSRSKKLLQRLGSWVVRKLSGTDVPDTTSGFRAYNREAAIQLLVVSNFTYTLESLIQAGRTLVAVEHVPITANPQTRQSRLFESNSAYVRRSALTIVRSFILYKPLRFFVIVAGVFFIATLIACAPFVIDLIRTGDTEGHLQSLIVAAVLAMITVQMLALGIIGDALAGQRVIGQRIHERVRRLELAAGVGPSHYEAGRVPERVERG